MARQKCTFKWRVKWQKRQKCTFKWQDKSKSVRLNDKTIVYG